MSELIASLLRASQHRFIGRLGKDPEVRYLMSGNCVANANIAINRPGAKKNDGQEPDWFRLEIWGEKAQGFADACSKGQLVDVTGRVRSDSYITQGGEQRTQLIINVESWSLVPVAGASTPALAATAAPAATPAASWQSKAPVVDESEVPF